MATGSLTLKSGKTYYTLYFTSQGWLAGEFLQYLDDILGAADREIAILKTLGYMLEIGRQPPPRRADDWVEVDLDDCVLASNSRLVRLAVNREDPGEDAPYNPHALRRVYEVLDRNDFTVELFE